ncbi:MAG TPA: pantoate--beta-alanine ligase [Phaeodactylibacter sp.]|nr:pantoate--beta-alanine ligase [Phaeodactylibacter sp.]
MYIFKKVSDLNWHLQAYRDKKRPVGFVPTMGALHQGHLSLVKRSLADNPCTVCSIFVNPTQFNESTDLAKYPRSPERDLYLLHEAGCDVVFMPTVAEVYPGGLESDSTVQLDFGPLVRVMEGAHRPGHFDGVAQVVKRLIDIVQPDRMYMGEKDYQQLLIVRSMVQQLGLPVEVVGCPIVREADGLAMSSRNQRLTAEQRQQAAVISDVLRQAVQWAAVHTPQEVEQKALRALEEAGLKPEYFTLADPVELSPIDHFPEKEEAVMAFVAAWAGEIRLIDNGLVKKD